MQSYYAARAAEYDRVYLKPERQDDIQQLQQWLPANFRGSRVLEVACGTGYWTQFIAPVASEIVALDSSPETMVIARRRVPEGKVRFMVGDAYQIPSEHGPFNAAFAGFWFSHVPKQRRSEFLVGLSNVLAPGATVVLLDNLFVPGSSTPVAEQDSAGNTYQVRKLEDGSSHRVLKNFPSEEELREAVAGVGREAVFTKFQYFWAVRYASTKP